MSQTVIELVLGAVIALLVTIWLESSRKPKEELSIAPPHDNRYQNRPASTARFLALEISNKPLPRSLRWMSRSPAVQCHGMIRFDRGNGEHLFNRAMAIRWSGSIEPIATDLIVSGVRVSLVDHTKLMLSTRVDIHPGESSHLDVAARFDDELQAFDWSNESYFSNPIWRAPEWTIPPGRHLLRVEVVSSGETCSGIFRFINDGPQAQFRLEPAAPAEVALLRATSAGTLTTH